MSGAAHDSVRLVVADLDGTLLHGADTFEGRFITQRSVDAIERLHDAGYLFAIATARPVSTGLAFAERLPADAVVYLNGALIDFKPERSDYALLTGARPAEPGHLVKIGFPSGRACDVCRMMLAEMPDLQLGIVMDDVRYTNFDVSVYWKTQTWRYTDFTDVPDGIADKLIVFPRPEQTDRLAALVPDDFDVHVSEGVMWMLMSPESNKEHALSIVCERLGVRPEQTVAFGDDVIDVAMLRAAGIGVAVANANPDALAAADEVCPSNDEDGVAQWIESRLLDRPAVDPR
ncbi:HAD family hydrolase [Bifidobacterium samirii]|uniref:HAD family hydrolase n=1 Tax=Bifidobacterium samirii TaxID=2306974 RepID=A0A430FTK7_9BIFI|nr:HAD family hydrolase [Bifidobacterium samirii]RSX56245.1 HAD family hydrolase [Bifidobacterium samirii]